MLAFISWKAAGADSEADTSAVSRTLTSCRARVDGNRPRKLDAITLDDLGLFAPLIASTLLSKTQNKMRAPNTDVSRARLLGARSSQIARAAALATHVGTVP